MATPKIAVIIGANRGIGRSTALTLASGGVDVILTYRSNDAEADAVVASIAELGRTAIAFQLDVGVVASFDAFADQVRSILQQRWDRDSFDFLVNNAGVGIYGSEGRGFKSS